MAALVLGLRSWLWWRGIGSWDVVLALGGMASSSSQGQDGIEGSDASVADLVQHLGFVFCKGKYIIHGITNGQLEHCNELFLVRSHVALNVDVPIS